MHDPAIDSFGLWRQFQNINGDDPPNGREGSQVNHIFIIILIVIIIDYVLCCQFLSRYNISFFFLSTLSPWGKMRVDLFSSFPLQPFPLRKNESWLISLILSFLCPPPLSKRETWFIFFFPLYPPFPEEKGELNYFLFPLNPSNICWSNLSYGNVIENRRAFFRNFLWTFLPLISL